MAEQESELTTRLDETNPIVVNHNLSIAPSFVAAELCVDPRRVDLDLNIRRVHRSAGVPATDREAPPSILWVATIQCIERKQDLAGLAPKDGLIAAKPVERVAGKIG